MLHQRAMEEFATHTLDKVVKISQYMFVRGRRCGCDCDQCIVSCRPMPSDLNSVEVLEILVWWWLQLFSLVGFLQTGALRHIWIRCKKQWFWSKHLVMLPIDMYFGDSNVRDVRCCQSLLLYLPSTEDFWAGEFVWDRLRSFESFQL